MSRQYSIGGEVDEAGSGLLAGFGISGVEPSDYDTRELEALTLSRGLTKVTWIDLELNPYELVTSITADRWQTAATRETALLSPECFRVLFCSVI
jgi:hypothetical protein